MGGVVAARVDPCLTRAAGACLDELYSLDPSGSPPWSWRSLRGPGWPAARQMLGMAATGGYLYIFGGQNEAGDRQFPHRSCWDCISWKGAPLLGT
jgi:hypothetical protein